ncbi:hypothetical protein, partial [Methylosinus sp. R-45379]|uniref:hypothetical protein n=1 Tax=Methylosinus sp. R-45379 TaxID=980563 RepID=UPI001AECF828
MLEIEIADHETAAMEKHDAGQRLIDIRRPINPQRDRRIGKRAAHGSVANVEPRFEPSPITSRPERRRHS